MTSTPRSGDALVAMDAAIKQSVHSSYNYDLNVSEFDPACFRKMLADAGYEVSARPPSSDAPDHRVTRAALALLEACDAADPEQAIFPQQMHELRMALLNQPDVAGIPAGWKASLPSSDAAVDSILERAKFSYCSGFPSPDGPCGDLCGCVLIRDLCTALAAARATQTAPMEPDLMALHDACIEATDEYRMAVCFGWDSAPEKLVAFGKVSDAFASALAAQSEAYAKLKEAYENRGVLIVQLDMAKNEAQARAEGLLIENKAQYARLAAVEGTAQQIVDLFVWEPSEETGKVEPHLDRTVPDFGDVLTELRDILRAPATEATGYVLVPRQLLLQWAQQIDNDGTSSQAGPNADELRQLASGGEVVLPWP